MMNVRIHLEMKKIDKELLTELKMIARSLTDDKKSVKIIHDSKDPHLLLLEFSMAIIRNQTTSADTIFDAIGDSVAYRDLKIEFPMSEEEQAHSDRKNAQARARRAEARKRREAEQK